MVSHVQREQGGNAGNDGGEAKAGTGAADRGASPSFAEVKAFFAERQVSNTTAHCYCTLPPCVTERTPGARWHSRTAGAFARQAEHLAKASQAYSFCFTQERALQGDWQWQAVTADGAWGTARRCDCGIGPGAARSSAGA